MVDWQLAVVPAAKTVQRKVKMLTEISLLDMRSSLTKRNMENTQK